MAENQKKILEMLSEKKITVEEAEKLLSLTGPGEDRADAPSGSATEKKRTAKYLRVVVQPGSENGQPSGDRVNVRIPMNLIRAGMKLTSLIPKEAADKVREAVNEKGIDFDLRNLNPQDIEELIEALTDLEVEVQSEDGEHVRVFAE